MQQTTSQTWAVATDTASLLVFDPERIVANAGMRYDDAHPDWENCPAVVAGQVSLLVTGEDGVFNVRVTTTGLSKAEKAMACQVNDALRVEVVSEKLCCLAAEMIPADAQALPSAPPYFTLANGVYQLICYALHQDGNAGLADMVICLKKQADDYTLPGPSHARIDWPAGKYLFGAPPKMKAGKLLTGKIWKTHRTESGLIIKADAPWPSKYRRCDAVLEDMSGVQRGDYIEFIVLSVDEEKELITGRLQRLLARKSKD